MTYNWQQKDWPEFTFDYSKIEEKLFVFAQKSGRISGKLDGLGKEVQSEAIIELLVSEAIKTSEIEGEYLSRQDVMSSIKKNLGVSENLPEVKDLRSRGIAQLLIDVRETYKKPLSRVKLFEWHKMVMQGNNAVKKGRWRSHSEPMQVVSGSLGKEKVHYEAPPSNQVPEEMRKFINWFNDGVPKSDLDCFKGPVRAAIAHFYFETIHPFEDGNGRIGRAIAEKALSQGLRRPAILSLSKAIEVKKKFYYESLKKAQRANEITNWLEYFIEVIIKAQDNAITQVEFSLQKARFFDLHKESLNERQVKVIKRILDTGPDVFEGGMNARKYMSISGASKATATRDLQDLNRLGIFISIGAGRSTRYSLNLPGKLF